MGSSKKSKDKDRDKTREHKKKRRRSSRSRSRSPHEKKHKRRDRDRDRSREKDRGHSKDRRKRDNEYDYEEPGTSAYDPNAPVEIPGLGDPYTYAEPPRTYGYMEEGELPGLGPDSAVQVKEEKTQVTDFSDSAGAGDSLSIQETNALRAKIGLKPLEMNTGSSGETVKKEDVHVPAVNISQVKKQEDIKQKLMAAKEKRRINALLGKIKTLGDNSEDEDDVSAWVKKMRKTETEKKLAAKRAKMMDEMDNEFGIGELVEEEFGVKQNYSSKDLAGLKVQHSGSSFKEGKTVILTLEDQDVLDDKEQTLVNVNMVDDEKYAKNVENKKKKPDYKPYDEAEFDEYGMLQKKDILEKYDEEIDGQKREGFKLKTGGRYVSSKEKLQEEMRAEIQSHRVELTLPTPALASEFYTEEEMQSFKKVKKKVRKIRKKPKALKADDLLPLPDDLPMDGEGIPGLDILTNRMKQEDDEEPDVDGPDEDLTGMVIDDEAANELQSALEKTRKLKQNKKNVNPDKRVADDINEQKQYDVGDSDSDDVADIGKANITLNQTSEFCRTLGDIPTYGQAGNRLEDEDDIMDFDQEKPSEDMDDANNPGWQEVAIDENRTVNVDVEESAVLDEEPVVGSGVAAALHLATKKGYLSEEKAKQANAKKPLTGIESENYSIEDKRYEDLDEKYRKRDRYTGGMLSEFKEKDGYKPNVKLDYVDDTGRLMSPKEAFRYLSHNFHGKGSGKMKTEKRKKKIEEEQLMKSMSSTDTPLGTAAMLEDKLSQQKVPYLQLSGNKTLTTDRISK